MPIPSTSEAQPPQVTAPSVPSTSDAKDSATLSAGLQALLSNAFEAGSPMAVMVSGSDTTSLMTKLNGKKQNQSLPPGDILVLVLPAEKRGAGVFLIEPEPSPSRSHSPSDKSPAASLSPSGSTPPSA